MRVIFLAVFLKLTRGYSDEDFENVLNSVVDGKINADFDSFEEKSEGIRPFYVKNRVPKPVQEAVDRPFPVYDVETYPVYVERKVPYVVEEKVPIPRKRIVERPYPVFVPIEKPVYYPVQRPVPVPIQVPFERLIPVPVVKPVAVPVQKPVPYPVEKIIPYKQTVHFDVPIHGTYPTFERYVDTLTQLHRNPGKDLRTELESEESADSFQATTPKPKSHYEVNEIAERADGSPSRNSSALEDPQDLKRWEKYFEKENLLNLQLMMRQFQPPRYNLFSPPRVKRRNFRPFRRYRPYFPGYYSQRRRSPYFAK